MNRFKQMLEWLSPHLRRARLHEMRGQWEQACEAYLLAGRPEQATRLQERQADLAMNAGAELRFQWYFRAMEWSQEPQEQQRLAQKILDLQKESPSLEISAASRHLLLEKLGLYQELGRSLEGQGKLEAALAAYVQGGLFLEIERLGAQLGRARQAEHELSEWAEELEKARNQGERLRRIQLLKAMSQSTSESHQAQKSREEWERLRHRLPGRDFLLDSVAFKHPLRILLGKELLLGRDFQSTLRLTGHGISRRHARVLPYQGKLFLEDLDSRSGTFLDKLPVEGPIELVGEGQFQLGEHLNFHFQVLPPLEKDQASLLLEARSLGGPILFLGGATVFGHGAGRVSLHHPALKSWESVFQILSAESQPLVAPVPGGPELRLGGNALEQPQVPFRDESLLVGGVEFRILPFATEQPR